MKRYLYSIQEGLYSGMYEIRTNGVIEAKNEADLKLILTEMYINSINKYIEDYDEYEVALNAAKNENIDFYYCEVDEIKANNMLTVQLNEWATNDFEDALIYFGISN